MIRRADERVLQEFIRLDRCFELLADMTAKGGGRHDFDIRGIAHQE
ncbi:hypothetical protein J3P88_12555 [Pseudomonas sp. Z3-6]